MLRLAALTTGRQDWGILRPLCVMLDSDAAFQIEILAGGMACAPAFGRIVDAIRKLNFNLVAEMEWAPDQTNAVEQAASAMQLVAAALERVRPDALLLVGDRYETAGAALAAAIVGVPIIHLYGGEETEGAIDNVLRHAITKLSHLHLVAHSDYAKRVVQMGEDPQSVHVVGSLGIDNIRTLDAPSRPELEDFLGLTLRSPIGLVTVHPTTLADDGAREVDAVVQAIRTVPATWVITLPNADPGNEAIQTTLRALVDSTPNTVVVPALGEARYVGLLRVADFVLGNSSSGLTEAPGAGVPTINVGDRQKGRIRPSSVIDVAPDASAIRRAIQLALSPDWRAGVRSQPQPFGDGHAAERITAILKAWHPPKPARKAFYDLPVGGNLFAAPMAASRG